MLADDFKPMIGDFYSSDPDRYSNDKSEPQFPGPAIEEFSDSKERVGPERQEPTKLFPDTARPKLPTAQPFEDSKNNPDDSLKLAKKWQSWHCRVAEVVSVRFDALARQAFAHSRPFKCKVSYMVTREKQIINIKLVEKSPNIVFNSMALMVLRSMNGNPILEFPEGSRRQYVERISILANTIILANDKYGRRDSKDAKHAVETFPGPAVVEEEHPSERRLLPSETAFPADLLDE